MTGNNIHKPPTASPDGGNEVNLPLICEATGLPTGYLTEENIALRLLPGVAAAFTDTELQSTHPVDTDPVTIEHFGETDFNTGVFGSRVRELLYGEDESLRNQADLLIRQAAYIFVQNVVGQSIALPSTPTVMIDTAKGKISVGQNTLPVPLATPPRVVMDYGPGLQGRFHIRRQIADLNEGRVPYTYLALAKDPFINEFLMEYWTARSSRQFFRNNILGNVYLGREDGMASATNEFVDTQIKHTGSAAVADVVIASGIHTAGHEEVGVAITNAHKLLRSGGTFLMRAPKTVEDPMPNVVPASTMVEMAVSAGFSYEQAHCFDLVTGGGPVPLTTTLAAFFQKQ